MKKKKLDFSLFELSYKIKFTTRKDPDPKLLIFNAGLSDGTKINSEDHALFAAIDVIDL